MLTYFFVSGTAFFVGAVILLAAVLGPEILRWKALKRYRYTVVIFGAGFILLSATPLSFAFYAVWIALVIAWTAAEALLWPWKRKLVLACRTVAAIACLVAIWLELPHHFSPSIPLAESQTLYVIGDSISVRLSSDDKVVWPELLAEHLNAKVVNLAMAGGTVSWASQKQAGRVQGADCVVLLEIGGNDLLGATTAADFESALDELIEKVSQPGRTIVMFELPLPPLRNGFGLAQRRVARKYGVGLIPKRVFARVLTARANTTDGLHLSQEGHARMAKEVGSCFHSSR